LSVCGFKTFITQTAMKMELVGAVTNSSLDSGAQYAGQLNRNTLLTMAIFSLIKTTHMVREINY